MISVATYKEAGKRYSAYRPLKAYVSITPALDKEQTPPANTIGVEYCGWGVEVPFYEVMTSTGTDRLFAYENGKLYLHPAPIATDGNVEVIWRKEHQYNPITKAFDTVGADDRLFIDMFEEIVWLEEQCIAIENGPVRSIVGHTEVSHEEQVREMRSRIRYLTDRLDLALNEIRGQLG